MEHNSPSVDAAPASTPTSIGPGRRGDPDRDERDHHEHPRSDHANRHGHGHGHESAAMLRRQCGWCCNTFAIVRRPGRPLIYCSRSCRQRAYERRRGLGVLPPPDRIITQVGGPLAHLRSRPGRYECGKHTFAGKEHAMRPAGILDGTERRLTLCGLLARAVPRAFVPTGDRSCLTCERVAGVRPPARPVQPSGDLAALRALLDVAAVEMSRSTASQHPLKGPGEILTDLLMAV